MFVNPSSCISDFEKKFRPRPRVGTKTFLDLSVEEREKNLFQTPAGNYFQSILPPEVWGDVVTAITETGIESMEAQRWVEYANSFGKDGNPVSPIAQLTTENPYNPEGFKYLYGEEDALTPMDIGYIMTSGAHAIDLRLQSIIENLPSVIKTERARLGLKTNEKYVIFNIGAGHCLDTVYALHFNPNLRDLVRVVCIDPDKDALGHGESLARKLGVQDNFEFISEKIENIKGLGKANLILFIGMFCPIPTKKCILTLNFVKKYLLEKGIIIFSTVQEKMLEEGALLDFIMWSYGWRMFFKADQEPGKIARMAGLSHEQSMDWEDELGYNRMTVARKNSFSIGKSLKNLFSLITTVVS